MKRILLTTAAALLGLGALGFASSHAATPVQANCDDDLSAKLLEYAGTGEDEPKGYTKLTTMFLTPEAQGETKYFHGGANTLQRATYYNADESALLMGNYDGTFGGVGGATGINSGYRNNDEGGVTHFVYTDDAATEVNLFTKRTDGWKAAGQRLGTYYRTLTQLSASVKNTNWTWEEGNECWKYSLDSIEVKDGEYSDSLLKDFQYFAAPMMLQNNYFSWTNIRVKDASDHLSIRLYSSSSDSTKSTVVGEHEALISEAKVYKGIHLIPKKKWVLKGLGDQWGEEGDVPLNEAPDLFLPIEQYSATTAIALGDNFKLYEKNSGTWIGFESGVLQNGAWFESAEGEKPNFVSKLDGEITLWWKPNQSALWISVNKAMITFEVTNILSSAEDGAWIKATDAVYVAGSLASSDWKPVAETKLTYQGGGKWSGKIEISSGYHEWKPVVADATNPDKIEWPPHGGNSDLTLTDTVYIAPGDITYDWN